MMAGPKQNLDSRIWNILRQTADVCGIPSAQQSALIWSASKADNAPKRVLIADSHFANIQKNIEITDQGNTLAYLLPMLICLAAHFFLTNWMSYRMLAFYAVEGQ